MRTLFGIVLLACAAEAVMAASASVENASLQSADADIRQRTADARSKYRSAYDTPDRTRAAMRPAADEAGPAAIDAEGKVPVRLEKDCAQFSGLMRGTYEGAGSRGADAAGFRGQWELSAQGDPRAIGECWIVDQESGDKRVSEFLEFRPEEAIPQLSAKPVSIVAFSRMDAARQGADLLQTSYTVSGPAAEFSYENPLLAESYSCRTVDASHLICKVKLGAPKPASGLINGEVYKAFQRRSK